MSSRTRLAGVIPSVVTPLTASGELHLDNLARHINTLADEGCHGILVVGTTGEGPSLSLEQRTQVIEAGLAAAQGIAVLAGTGCASLSDTIELTRRAYAVGVDATLIIPPFFFKAVPDQGLLAFYRRLLDEAVPEDGLMMLYHFPTMSQVPITFELLDALLAVEPDRVAGVKDSSGDPDHLRALCRCYPQLAIFPGNDALLLQGLTRGAAGCITAPSNCFAPLNLAVYQAFKAGEPAAALQDRLTAARRIIDRYPSLPASQKHLLSRRYGTDGWALCPPLVPLTDAAQQGLMAEAAQADLPAELDWLMQASV